MTRHIALAFFTFGLSVALLSACAVSGSRATACRSEQGRNPAIGFGGAPLLTVANPLPIPPARQVSLSEAASKLGGPITLPETALVKASDRGCVWAAGPKDGEVVIGVSFPRQGFAITYKRPPTPDPLANYRSYVNASRNSSVIYLKGNVPALTQTSTRPDGSIWDWITFVSGRTSIVVMGRVNLPTERPIAKSILAQASS